MELTKEELKAVHNNVMTIMEKRIMSMVSCDRKTANLVANEILELDRKSEELLNTSDELCRYYVAFAHNTGFGSVEMQVSGKIKNADDVIDLREEIQKATGAEGVIVLNWVEFK